MDNQPTCGKGLAAQAVLPAMLGELTTAMARVLDLHKDALDLADPDARPEHQAYTALVLELRRAAQDLAAIAQNMSGYRDLPMGRHDAAKMASPTAVEAFGAFVLAERRLVSMLTESVSEHESMLEAMR